MLLQEAVQTKAVPGAPMKQRMRCTPRGTAARQAAGRTDSVRSGALADSRPRNVVHHRPGEAEGPHLAEVDGPRQGVGPEEANEKMNGVTSKL